MHPDTAIRSLIAAGVIALAVAVWATATPRDARPLVSDQAPASALPEDSQSARFPGSTLRFTARQAGADFDGRFESFSARVHVDPDKLADSGVEAFIDLDSVQTDNAERDDTLRGPDFFATGRWPRARFVAIGLRVDAGQYVADGQLTLRGNSGPVTLRFRHEPPTDSAPGRLVGDARLRRLAFGIGAGEWADTDAIGDEIRIAVDVNLR